jgi:maltooligosyltrehalose trehalohydrolase
MGATPTVDGVRFKVWAPAARSLEVEFDDGRLAPLARQADGVWVGLLAGAGHATRYRYRLNGQLSRPDPYSRCQPEGPHGPSEVVDAEAFEWRTTGWEGVGIGGLVIYQAHVGTATPEGTFDGLVGQLPRLRALGINAIEPLPIAEFPGSRNWGYDGVNLFAVSHVYGGPNGLKRFIDAAHAHGIGVIIDVVYNHLGPDGNYLRDFASEYFTDRYETPWGEAFNYDGPCSEWVRKFVLDNARFWIHEYRADGLRLDATHAIFDHSPTHILSELTQAVRTSVPSNRQTVLIAETSENNVRYLRSAAEGGYGLDAVYADDFHHALRRYLAGDHEGYFARFDGTLDEVARCIRQGWLFDGEPRGTRARDRPAWQFVYAIQNHDQVGNRAMGERLHHQIGLERFAAASALLLFLPNTPMLFMGQEFAASSPFQYFTDHNPELGRLVTEGRRKEFQAFSAFADPAAREQIPDPQAEVTFSRSKVPLAEAESPAGSALQALYTELIALRRFDPVLRDQARERTEPRVLSRDVLAVRRWLKDQERLLVANFGDTDFGSGEYGEGWRVLVASARPPATSDGVSVAARSAVVLARGPA